MPPKLLKVGGKPSGATLQKGKTSIPPAKVQSSLTATRKQKNKNKGKGHKVGTTRKGIAGLVWAWSVAPPPPRFQCLIFGTSSYRSACSFVESPLKTLHGTLRPAHGGAGCNASARRCQIQKEYEVKACSFSIMQNLKVSYLPWFDFSFNSICKVLTSYFFLSDYPDKGIELLTWEEVHWQPQEGRHFGG